MTFLLSLFLFFRFICFSFVSSTTLEDVLGERTEICGQSINFDFLCVMFDVIKAIEHLHKIGICHNDICASNVLVSSNNEVST